MGGRLPHEPRTARPARGRSAAARGAAGLNLGQPHDYRVPDGGLLRPGTDQLYYPTAALVLEIVSPDDETWTKLDFYAAQGVDELLIVDPQERRVHWLERQGREYRPIEQSTLIALGPAERAERIDWPE